MEKNQQYKIVFVKEDSIEYYGEPGANTMHSIYLAEYIEKYFKEHPVLGRLTVATGADSLAYALTYFENMIIVMNETRMAYQNMELLFNNAPSCIRKITTSIINIIRKFILF